MIIFLALISIYFSIYQIAALVEFTVFKSSEASSVCGFLLGFIHFYSYVLFLIKMPSFQLLLVFNFTVDVAFSSRFTFTFLRSSVSSADLLSVSGSFYSIHCVVLCHTSCFLCLVMCLLPHLIIFVGFSCVSTCYRSSLYQVCLCLVNCSCVYPTAVPPCSELPCISYCFWITCSCPWFVYLLLCLFSLYQLLD